MKWLHIVLMSVGAYGVSLGQDQTTEKQSPAQAKALIQEWMKTERLLSEESKNWVIEQEQLKELISLYETEITLIREELDAAGDVTVSLDQKTEALKKKAQVFESDRTQLKSQVLKQRQRLLGIAAYFPHPLTQQLERDLVILAAEESSLRENVVAMLNVLKAAGQFNRIISYSDEMQDVDGEKRQLRVLYLGLARAFYLSGETAGVGAPAAGKWQWTVDNSIYAAVKKSIAVYQKTSSPELITLPVEVQN